MIQPTETHFMGKLKHATTSRTMLINGKNLSTNGHEFSRRNTLAAFIRVHSWIKILALSVPWR
jgi:hypothetical protein